MTGIAYSDLVAALQNLLVDNNGGIPSADFTGILPRMIDYAENRIYRKLNFLATRTVPSTTNCVVGQRTYAIPAGMITVEGVAIITPSNAASPAVGTRNHLEPVNLEVIDFFWPSEAETDAPEWFGMKDAANIVIGPSPDQTYPIEFTGVTRPAPISATNTTTYISTNYADLMVAACMIYGGLWQKDFGGNFNPETQSAWEAQYDILEATAMAQEERLKQAKTLSSNRQDGQSMPSAPMPMTPPLPTK